MGDIAGNTRIVLDTLAKTNDDAPDLVVFPELFIQGYPPRDLLERSSFIRRGLEAIEEIARASLSYPEVGIVFGCALPNNDPAGKGLSNSAVLVSEGKLLFHQNKSLIPCYDVFDETRYFDAARRTEVYAFKGEKLGLHICEDAWNHTDLMPRRLYEHDPVEKLASLGATVLINISGSPFHSGKEKLRHTVMQRHAVAHRLPFVFVNNVGGNDELIFDGNSMFFDAKGALRGLIPAFKEGTLTVDTARPGPAVSMPDYDSVANVYDALVLGTADYVRKCGFTKVLLGLSGGIDSAVTAAIAAVALGPKNVLGVTMPSRYSSSGSVDDSTALARNLGIEFQSIPIEPGFQALLGSLAESFAGRPPDLAEENLQARVRGTVLMALANKFNRILLTTGNKSEMAVGYCTLYGDMNGGLAVIADLPKTMVYKVARHINRATEIIPAASISKAPSAELRPNQTDQDTLPPYETLDAILALLIEEGKRRDDIVAAGFAAQTVDWVMRAVRLSEYKRRQAAPGLKVTPKAFGMGRRFPIAARYEL
jgi:NAD+ synthase (glutamine-hydrolysing)